MGRAGMVWRSLALIAAVACGRPASQGAAGDSVQVVEEARRFMDGYASELRSGNRAAIAARYDRSGAYALGNGFKAFQPHDSIVASYQSESWKPPTSFEWLDLSFEPIGNDAIMVAGRFRWGLATVPRPLEMSYSALLRRQEGVLRIRLEDESADPTTIPRPPVADSARGR